MRFEIGTRVKVDHPITCGNPTEWFNISSIKFEHHHAKNEWKVWVRGTSTMWFNADMILEAEYNGVWKRDD